MQATVPSRPQTSNPLTLLITRWLTSVALVGAIFLALAVAAAALFQMSYQGRVYPGVRAWGLDLSGLKPEEAALALTGAFTYPQNEAFILADGASTRAIRPADFGVTFDVGATVAAAYNVGRSGNLLADWQTQFSAWHAGTQIAPILAVDEARTAAYLNSLAQETYKPPVEAALRAEGVNVIAEPGAIGRELQIEALRQALFGYVNNVEKAAINLPFTENAPLVLDASAQAEAARTILSQPLVLSVANSPTGDGGPWTIPPEQLATMLRITRVQEGNSARFEVTLDANTLAAVLQPLAEPLKRQPQNARFIFNDETKLLEVIQPSVDGRDLDVEGTINAINTALPKGEHTVPLAFHLQAPPVPDTMTGAELGITELVSAQYTTFKGSIPERLQNIQTAAARFHGLLVPPGAVFSFAENVGDISLDSGFAEALIIYGGRTIRGIGGGVCQVSTTLFRAVWFGGFPIVERNSHAYRVGYYEQNTGSWKGPGLDAAVFTPLVDFKFQNDTPHWLLMETYFYPNAGQLEWKFYSTSDGRQVQVSGPVVENIIPAPEPKYEENAELPTGTIKQVDFQADGADVTVTRTITRDGVRINTSELPLRTRYQPWQAIYQYGPGTEGIPTPTLTPDPNATPTPVP